MRWNPLQQIEDVLNKFGTERRIAQFQSGELVLVEREELARLQRLAGPSSEVFPNGGVTYALGIDVEAFLADWVRFYKEVFDLTVDVSTVRLPPFRFGFGWGVLGVPGITNEAAFQKSGERFNARKYTDTNLDQAIPFATDERTAKNGSYVIWCRATQEADPNLAGISADQIADQKLRTMTFLERELLGLWFYWKTGGLHLDRATWTLCSGSRSSNGGVPHVNRYAGRLFVDQCDTSVCSAIVHAREVVEVDPPAEQAA